METENSVNENLAIEDYSRKLKVSNTLAQQSLGSGNNDWYSEICNRINKGKGRTLL